MQQSHDTHPIEYITPDQPGGIPGWREGIPVIRLFTCGLLAIEILQEVPEADPALARYEVLPPERLRGAGSAPACHLLKLLVSQAERYAPKDWLMTHLREGKDEQECITPRRLENIVSALRKLICLPNGKRLQDLLSYERATHESGDGYRLAGYPFVWLDIDALSWNVKQACLKQRFGDDPFPYWQRAYELASRGTFLLDEPSSEWARKRRKEIQDHLRQSVHALARLYLSRYGEAAEEEVLQMLSTYRRSHPTDEDLLRPLLQLLAKRGRYGEVLDHYEALERGLAARGLTKDGKERTPHRLTQDIADYARLKLREGTTITFTQEDRHSHPFQLSTLREQEEHIWQLDQDTRNLRASLPVGQMQQDARWSMRSLALPWLFPTASSGQQDTASTLFIPSTALSRSHVFPLPISTLQHGTFEEKGIPDCATRFGLILAQIITLIEQWYGMAHFCHDLQHKLDQTMKGLEILKSHYPLDEYILSRRHMLVALAALPATMLTSSQQAYKLALHLEEFLPQCTASVTACWHLSGGSHLDTIAPIVDSYLPTLVAVMNHVPSYQQVVADLVAQCYFLKTILAWHLEGLENAESYCLQALHYSEIARNPNLQLTALNQHALIAYYGKQFQKALLKSEEALTILEQTPQGQIFPIVQGRVYMYLAAIQAQHEGGNAEQTLELAQKAFVLQTAMATPVPLYADCGEAPLTLWEGLTHYHLSQKHSAHAQQALASLRVFGQLQPSMKIPERFRLECLNNRTLAAIQCNEMEEAIACLKGGKQGAKALESKQRHAEVTYAYQQMLRQWPKEPEIQKLSMLPESLS